MCGSCMSHESRMNESCHKYATSHTPATAPALRGIDAQSSRAHIRVMSHITGPTAVYVWLTCPSCVADALYRHLPRLSLSPPFVPPRLSAIPLSPFSGSPDFARLVFILAHILHVQNKTHTHTHTHTYFACLFLPFYFLPSLQLSLDSFLPCVLSIIVRAYVHR